MSEAEKPIRVLIADDHPLLREGIGALIDAEPDMQLVAQAANGREALVQFKLKRPDITLMDLQMPEMGGIEAIIAIRAEFPAARGFLLQRKPLRITSRTSWPNWEPMTGLMPLR